MPPSPLRIDIVSDVVCPWCAIGYYQLATALAQTGTEAEITFHPFELNPDMPPEGQDLREHLAQKYGTTPEDSRRARARITDLGAEVGFTFAYTDESRMPNTFRAHQLIRWAGERGRALETKLALFSAYFTAGEDVNDPEVLVRVAETVGLLAEEARAMLESGTEAAAVRQEESFWTAQGITGVPAMVFDRKYLVTGAQGTERYAEILRQLAGMRAA